MNRVSVYLENLEQECLPEGLWLSGRDVAIRKVAGRCSLPRYADGDAQPKR